MLKFIIYPFLKVFQTCFSSVWPYNPGINKKLVVLLISCSDLAV